MEIKELLKIKYPHYYARIAKNFEESTKQPFTNENITVTNLTLLTEYLKTKVAGNSVRTYNSMIKSVINTLMGDNMLPNLPAGWQKSLSSKQVQAAMCYLTEKDIAKIVAYQPVGEYEANVRAQFLIECYTGARTSDIENFDETNIEDGYLTYVSQKTKIRATIPLKPLVRELIESGVHKHIEMPLKTRNEVLRRILRLSGIKDIVKVFKCGKEYVGEKYIFCSTHTGRRSFASNMYLRGVDLYTISKLMGHSSVEMTAGYIVCGVRKLPQAALDFFK